MMSIIQKIKNSGAIQEILQKKVKDKEKLDEIAETLFNVISVDIRFIFNVDKVMEENNIELTVDESDNLIKLLGDLCYEVPSWSLNGYTPNEKYNDEEKEKKCNKKKSCFDDFSDNRKKEIYIIHYTDINGIIKIDKMVEILNEEHHLKTTKKEVTKIAKNCDATYIIEDYICFDDFDDETLEIVKGLKTFYNYKIIDDIDNLIQERNDNEDKLAAICSKYNINDWVIERIDYNIMYGIFSEKLLEEILKYHGIKMSSKKQHQLYQEIEPIINETRMWTLNGYKPSELENK